MNPTEYANTLLQAEGAGVPVDWKAAFINLVSATEREREAKEAEVAEVDEVAVICDAMRTQNGETSRCFLKPAHNGPHEWAEAGQ